jgi:glycosyltransferase involved in cell wall biosynthesis
MPALNEQATIVSVIDRIPTCIEGIGEIVTVVVDDGSSDNTATLARQAGAIVVQHPCNMGVGKAFATGIEAALRMGADIIVNIDADGQFDPTDIPALIQPIRDERFGFVTCTRFGNVDFIPQMPWIKKWGNRMMCRLVNWVIWNARFTDVSCGFRAYSRDTAMRLNLFGDFTYTHETFVDLAAKGVRMTEIPLRVRGVRQFGESRVAGSLWKYAVETLPIILRAMRDTRPLKFFGSLAAAVFLVGLVQLGIVATWWLVSGRTSPWTSLIVTGASCIITGVIVGVMALVADQLGRVRRIQEDVLRHVRARAYDDGRAPVAISDGAWTQREALDPAGR